MKAVTLLTNLALLASVAQVTTFASAKDATRAFSAEDMLSAPRPQPGIVSPDRLHSLSVVDQWNPKTDSIARRVYLVSLDIKTPSPISLFNSTPSQARDFLWIDNSTLAYLNVTSLYSVELNQKARKGVANRTKELEFPRGINPSGLQYESETGSLIFQGQVWGDGDFGRTAENDKAYQERGTTGVVFDDLFVRHWDTWRTPGKVWTIGAVPANKSSRRAGYLQERRWINLLNGTGLESKMDPHGSVAVSSTHLAFTVKSRYLNYATHTREDVYTIPLPGARKDAIEAMSGERWEPTGLTLHDHGAISGLTFSPDGQKLAWLEMDEDGYESDKRTVIVHDFGGKKPEKGQRWTNGWDQSPASITWSLDSKSLYLLAEHHGRVLPYLLSHPGHTPVELGSAHTTTSITPLSDFSALVSVSSLVSPVDDHILELQDKAKGETPTRSLRQITNWSKDYIGNGFDDIAIEEMWFKGADEWDVMAWVLRPLGATNSTRAEYPLAFFVHGGPQGAWEDGWSTRWNPALFAAQGYIVVAVNPTGSTGYGQEFCDKIKEDWGGGPFKDLLAGYQAALSAYPQIDTERTAMLGASYGGYMANWIQGHNDQFGFKAIVCHDGIFDTTSAFYETEEVWFPQREFGGDPTRARALYEKWNPMNHVGEWKTPELVIHSGKDFRLLDGQGIAAFTALQVQGVPSRFLYFPDENHWVIKPSNSIKWHYEVFRWLEEWIGKTDVQESVEKDAQPDFVIQV